MSRFESLEIIKNIWDDNSIKLGDKIQEVSHIFYSNGLDVEGTAVHIKATSSELEAFLQLGELNEDILDLISEVDPPKATWLILANASDEEIIYALKELKKENNYVPENSTASEYIYNKMSELSGPSVEDRVRKLTNAELYHVWKKCAEFTSISPKTKKFIGSLAAQLGKGKVLSVKQISALINTLNEVADKKVITRNSKDGDSEICNKILDALGR